MSPETEVEEHALRSNTVWGSLAGGRFQNCMRELRSRANDVEDDEKGSTIAKKDWDEMHVRSLL